MLNRSRAAVAAVVLVACGLSGCSLIKPAQVAAPQPVAPATPDPHAVRLAPLDTRQQILGSPEQEIVGETQVLFARYENTFSAIGREYDLGYEALRRANPGVDQWLPGEGTPIYLPTQMILPDAPRKGIVVNVAAMRLFYYTTEPDPTASARKVLRVTSHPIGIGAQGWATPIGEAHVTQKARDPVWYVPASVRKEHAERGDRLPSIVQPGPDNPLGKFALALSIPGYLIHGTNKPAGVGMRSSHGCIRLYPEDIEEIYSRVPKGTPVRIVDQPVLAGWRDGTLFLEVHPMLAEEPRDLAAEADAALARALQRAGNVAPVVIDRAAVQRIVAEQRGIPLPVLVTAKPQEQYLAAARVIENTVPAAPRDEQAPGVSVQPAVLSAAAPNPAD